MGCGWKPQSPENGFRHLPFIEINDQEKDKFRFIAIVQFRIHALFHGPQTEKVHRNFNRITVDFLVGRSGIKSNLKANQAPNDQGCFCVSF